MGLITYLSVWYKNKTKEYFISIGNANELLI